MKIIGKMYKAPKNYAPGDVIKAVSNYDKCTYYFLIVRLLDSYALVQLNRNDSSSDPLAGEACITCDGNTLISSDDTMESVESMIANFNEDFSCVEKVELECREV